MQLCKRRQLQQRGDYKRIDIHETVVAHSKEQQFGRYCGFLFVTEFQYIELYSTFVYSNLTVALSLTFRRVLSSSSLAIITLHYFNHSATPHLSIRESLFQTTRKLAGTEAFSNLSNFVHFYLSTSYTSCFEQPPR